MIKIAMLGLAAVIAIGLLTVPAYADVSSSSPLKQMKMGVPINEIQCIFGKVLMESPSGKPYCLSEGTAAKLADRGFSLVVLKENVSDDDDGIATSTNSIIDKQQNQDPPQVTILQIASPLEYVDDGRKYNDVVQRTAGPRPIYDEIMAYELVIGNDDVSGTTLISSPPHEKYSKNQGVGLYIEDWMPTHIIDGYKLLYVNVGYYDYSLNHNPRSTNNVHTVAYQFVPNDFILYANVTDTSLYKQSNAYRIVAKINSTPYDETEDIAERLWDARESQSGNYGGFREMTRDGKFVAAYEGGNDLNRYTASAAFHPDEYTILYVNSNHHTLDELIPVFESIMK